MFMVMGLDIRVHLAVVALVLGFAMFMAGATMTGGRPLWRWLLVIWAAAAALGWLLNASDCGGCK